VLGETTVAGPEMGMDVDVESKRDRTRDSTPAPTTAPLFEPPEPTIAGVSAGADVSMEPSIPTPTSAVVEPALF
jgi:hypothetical protein